MSPTVHATSSASCAEGVPRQVRWRPSSTPKIIEVLQKVEPARLQEGGLLGRAVGGILGDDPVLDRLVRVEDKESQHHHGEGHDAREQQHAALVILRQAADSTYCRPNYAYRIQGEFPEFSPLMRLLTVDWSFWEVAWAWL
jgi:hypothetical protein